MYFSMRRLKAKVTRKKVSTSSRVVVIDGILYKASGSKLIKTGSKSVDHRKLTRSKVATSVVTKGKTYSETLFANTQTRCRIGAICYSM